jgi:serine protease
VSSPPTDQIIVKLKNLQAGAPGGITDAQLQALNTAAGVRLQRFRLMSGGAVVVQLPSEMNEAAAQAIANRLAKSPLVEYAETDRIALPLAVPNDPRYNEQWHYFESVAGINLPAAWDITTGSDDIFVAVIDTGIVEHEDLAGRVQGGYDMISMRFNARDGDGRDPDPSDEGDWSFSRSSSWHGTHVAGTIGAASNNGVGVAGVNWTSKVVPVRVLGRIGGFTSDIVDGIRWAAGLPVPSVPNNPHVSRVINMSLGGSGSCGSTYQNAINDAVAAGTVVVVAAGNSNIDAAGATPANCSNVVTVAAVDRGGDKASYSNFGAVVEVAAPGGETTIPGNGVLSTLNSGTQGPVASPGGDTYAFYQGTSMATPHVAGVVSLMLSVNSSLTPAQVTAILQATARPFPRGSGCSGRCGAGIVDAEAAVKAAAP